MSKTTMKETFNCAFGLEQTEDNEYFRLDKEFLDKFKGKKPKFGFNGLGELVFYRTYSRIKKNGEKESALDTFTRVVEGTFEIQRRHCNKLHITWTEDKAQKSAQEMFQRMWEFKFLPPGRGLWAMGTEFMWERGGASLNNCFHKDTEIITRDGIKKIGDTVNTTQRLLTRNGKWVDSKIKSFGKQEIWKLVVSRGRHRKTILTTENHRWLVKSKVRNLAVSSVMYNDNNIDGLHNIEGYKTRDCDTINLKKGMRLCANFGAGINNPMLRPSIIGIMHGICNGDGTTGSPNPAHGTYLYLCGNKDKELLKYFSSEFHITDAPERGSEGAKRVADLPRYYRSLPDISEASTYLYGWLAGYFAADGKISKKGAVQISSANIDNLKHVQSVCAILGIGCHDIVSGLQTVRYRDGSVKKFVGHHITLFADHLRSDFFLLSAHKERFISIASNKVKDKIPMYNYWYVESVEATGEYDEVYCPQVPDYNCFTLAGNILTGNCGYISTIDIDKDPSEPFAFMTDMSMLGVGIGFDTRGAGKLKITRPNDKKYYYQIPDTREGWVESIKLLIKSYTSDSSRSVVVYDYSQIRQAGSQIKGFGGKASGPDILRILHEDMRKLLDVISYRDNPTLTSVDIGDLMNMIGKCVVAGNVRRCLPKGTLVHLKRGLTPIEQVQVGDLVLTSDGYHPVAENVYQGVQSVITIKSQMGDFRCTARHKMAVLNDIGTYDWKCAYELSAGDKLVFVDEVIPGVDTVLPSYNVNSRGKELVVPGLTPDVAWFIGMLHGDGYVYPGRLYKNKRHHGASVTIPINRDEYYDRLLSRIDYSFSLFGSFSINDQPSQDNCVRRRVISKNLALYFYKNFKQAKKSLHVHECIRLAKVDVRCAYLAGLIDSDGSTKNRPVTLVSSVYYDFVRQIQAVYSSLGIPTKWKLRSKADGNSQAKWDLSLVGDFAIKKFNELIKPYLSKDMPVLSHTSSNDFGYPNEWVRGKVNYGNSWTPQSDQMTHNRALLCGVKTNLVPIEVIDVVDEGITAQTYDISVPDRSEFVAQGLLTHNTAQIMFGEPDDHEYCSMKNPTDGLNDEQKEVFNNITNKLYSENRYSMNIGDLADNTGSEFVKAMETWNALNDRRWASNNSIFATVGMDYEKVSKQIAVNGEPGFLWLDNIRNYGRMIDGRQEGIDHLAMGANPCNEQTLESHELCVSGSTMIQTKNGVYPISELVGQNVEIWNGDEWSVVTPRKTGSGRKLYRVELSDGSYLDTTSNHGWSVKPIGKRVFRRLETQQLPIGAKVIPFVLSEVGGKRDDFAFEMGYCIGDGYASEASEESAHAMACACGPKAKLQELGLRGRWYKPQIKEGYTDPYNRINMQDCLTIKQLHDLRNKDQGLPEFVREFDKESILAFTAGWIESDGSVIRQKNTDNYVIYGLETKLRDMQLLLRRAGINHTHIALMHQAGQVTNKGIRKRDCWRLYIPSYEAEAIPTRFKKAAKFGNRLRRNPRHKSVFIDMAKKQKILSVIELPNTHDTFCFDEPKNHMGVFGNVLTYQCTLVETFPSNHENAEDYHRTLKFAYLYAKTVTLMPTHCKKTNSVLMRNKRIGLSQSGIVQAFKKFGRRKFLNEFCDKGYKVVKEWDNTYSRWLCCPKSIKVTSIKPSGSVSLVAGCTAGIHYTIAPSRTYWRRVRIAADSVLCDILRDAGYHVEPSINDHRTSIVKFGISEPDIPTVGEVSIFTQMKNLRDLQFYYADNQVSCTIQFSKDEEHLIPVVLDSFDDELKGVSFLPLENHGYAQPPYEAATAQEIADYNSNIKEIDFTRYLYEDSTGVKFCDGDTCVVSS